MDLGCIETVVKTKKNPLMSVAKVALIVVAALCILIGAAGLWIALLLGIAAGVGAYFAAQNCDVDYEYSLVDRELRLAKIMNKSSRKNLGTFDLDKMEILAPANSWHLDDFKNRQFAKTLDYSKHDPEEKDTKYVLCMSDAKVFLSFEGEEAKVMLDTIRQFAPRKVFKD